MVDSGLRKEIEMEEGLQSYLKVYFLKVLTLNKINDNINDAEIVILK